MDSFTLGEYRGGWAFGDTGEFVPGLAPLDILILPFGTDGMFRAFILS